MAAMLQPCLAMAIAHGELSARERRKQRMKRRSELAESRRVVKEQIDGKYELAASSKEKWRPSDASVTKLADLGPQWYVLRVWKGREKQTAESLRSTLKLLFPSADVEVLCPMVPRERLYKGKPRTCVVPFFEGHVFLKCIMDLNMYRAVVEEPDVFSFSSLPHKLKDGYDPKLLRGGYLDRHVPVPFPAFQFKLLLDEAKKVEKEFAVAQAERQLTVPSSGASEVRESETISLVEPEPEPETETKTESEAEVGEEVLIVSGPYQNFRGRILEFLPDGQVKVSVHVFGSETEVQVHASQLN